MLTEQSAYGNRWRRVSPIAKGCFSLCGMIAAFAAGSPGAALLVALSMAAATIAGAQIPPSRYLRIAAPALIFLAAGSLPLLISLDFGTSSGGISYSSAQPEFHRTVGACFRSLACLASLLFLALTTPLPDIITLLRRCKAPDTLLDLMFLCYRTLFVLSEAVHETITAQSARLGYATAALSFRSLGVLIANLAVQVWQRSQALHLAALARNNDGALHFLENRYRDESKNVAIATVAGIALIALAVTLR